jgi:hypothetical protein
MFHDDQRCANWNEMRGIARRLTEIGFDIASDRALNRQVRFFFEALPG